jgi:3-oxoacyl-[acyl-carrier-protein] synthase-3
MASQCNICGTAAVVPRRALASTELGQRLGHGAGWIEQSYHIRSRGVAEPDETSSSLGAQAARQALAAAGWEASSLDVIIGACGVMEQPIPGTASLIQRRLGLGASGIPAFDVNATCLSFLLALDQACLGLAARRWRRALIVSADIASAALDFSTPGASVIFGDGAAAAAVEAGDGASGLLASRLETYGDDSGLCTLAAGGTRLRPHENIGAFLAQAYFRMDGRGTFLAAARRLPGFLDRLLHDAGTRAEDIDLVIPHQASATALDHLRRVFPHARKGVVDIFADHGNQIAASLPSALHAAIASGQLCRGDTALLIGSAAGLSLGGAVLRY